MEFRAYEVLIQGPFYSRSVAVRATSARSAASLATGYDDAYLTLARGTVETVERAEFKGIFIPRITAVAIEVGKSAALFAA